jgi:hypothetical protein
MIVPQANCRRGDGLAEGGFSDSPNVEGDLQGDD